MQSFLLLIRDNKIHHVVLTHNNKYITHILMHFIHLRIHTSIIDKKKMNSKTNIQTILTFVISMVHQLDDMFLWIFVSASVVILFFVTFV